MRHVLLALVEIYRRLRGRGRSDIGEPVTLAESPEKVVVLLRNIAWRLAIRVLVLNLNARFSVHRKRPAVSREELHT